MQKVCIYSTNLKKGTSDASIATQTIMVMWGHILEQIGRKILFPRFILLKTNTSLSGFSFMCSDNSLVFEKKPQVPFLPLEIR